MGCLASALPMPLLTSCAPCFRSGTLSVHVMVKHSIATQCCRAADAAKEELVLAQHRLGRCSVGETLDTPQLIPAPARNMGQRLQQAYTLIWRLQLSEGWHMLKVTHSPSLAY